MTPKTNWIEMGLKDNQLFPIERPKVAKIQGHINTCQWKVPFHSRMWPVTA